MFQAICLCAALLVGTGDDTLPDSAYTPDERTMVLLHFDGDARDAGQWENHGDVQGECDWAEGRFGRCLSLNGKGGVILRGNGTTHVGGRSWTVECWIKPDRQQPSRAPIVSGGWGHERHYTLAIDGGKRISATFSAGARSGTVRSADVSKTLCDGRWHHVAAVLDRERAGEVRLYLDGRRIEGGKPAFCAPIAFEDHRMGVAVGASTPWYVGKDGFLGLIDEVRLSNTVRREHAASGPVPEEARRAAAPRPRFVFDAAESKRPLTLAPQSTVIVLPGPAGRGDHEAARELQSWLQKVSDSAAGYDIVQERDVDSIAGKAVIALGRSRWIREDELAGLAPAGFLIRRKANVLVVAGGTSTGTYLGAVRLLDRVGGVRFYMPTDLFTHWNRGVPQIGGDLDVRIDPFVKSAMMTGIVGIPGDGGWTRRNGVARRTGGTHQHSFYGVFPPERFAKSHPAIYPILDGKRYVPADGRDQRWQPCLSEPALVKTALQSARRHFTLRPGDEYLAYSVQDGHVVCQCPRCRAAYDRHKAEGRPDQEVEARGFSQLYWRFIAKLAGRFAEAFPRKKVLAMAYGPARFPPEDDLPPNVILFTNFHIAEWEADRILAPDAETGVSRLDLVLSRCRYYGNHDWYHGNGFLMPRIYSGYWSRFMRHLAAEVDGAYMHAEAYPHWGLAGPKLYVTARLWSEPDLDVEALLERFCTDLFGPAAGPMREYFTQLEKLWIALDNVKGPERKLFLWQRQFLADEEDLAAIRQCRKLLDQALAKANTDEQRKRIELFSDAFLVSQTLYQFAGAKKIQSEQVEAFRRHVREKILPNPMTFYRTSKDAEDLAENIEAALRVVTADGKKVAGPRRAR